MSSQCLVIEKGEEEEEEGMGEEEGEIEEEEEIEEEKKGTEEEEGEEDKEKRAFGTVRGNETGSFAMELPSL